MNTESASRGQERRFACLPLCVITATKEKVCRASLSKYDVT